MLDRDKVSLHVRVGDFEYSYGNRITMGIMVKGDGHGRVVLTCKDGRKEAYAFLDDRAYEQLRTLIAQTDETIKDMSARKQMLALE